MPVFFLIAGLDKEVRRPSGSQLHHTSAAPLLFLVGHIVNLRQQLMGISPNITGQSVPAFVLGESYAV